MKPARHRQLSAKQKILDFLQSSGFRAGQKLPSEREIAARCDLTRHLVGEIVHEMLGEGVLRRQGYKLWLVGERPSDPRPRIAIFCGLIPGIEKIVGGISVDLHLDCEIYPRALGDIASSARRVVELVDAGFSGFVFWPLAFDEGVLSLIRKRGAAAVVVGGHCESVDCLDYNFSEMLRCALTHLRERGHTEFGLVLPATVAPNVERIRENYQGACAALNSPSSMGRIFHVSGEQDLLGALKTLTSQRKPATAVLVLLPGKVEMFCKAAARFKLVVPGQLSVVVLGRSSACTSHDPPLSTVEFDDAVIARMALSLLRQRITELRRLTKEPVPFSMLVSPSLVRRESVALLPGRAPASPGQPRDIQWRPASASLLLHSAAEKQRAVDRSWMSRYTLATTRTEDIVPVDLLTLANARHNQPHGWFGNKPLLHLPTGRRLIHGVPFEIIDPANEQASAIILATENSREDRRHPSSISIPVGRKARAVYFLHACGEAGVAGRFATISLKNPSGKTIARTFLTLPNRERGPKSPGPTAETNIQDWWPDCPQTSGPHHAHLIVSDPAAPLAYERYLYTLEIPLSDKAGTLKAIHICLSDGAEVTYGLLAISVALAK